MGVLFALLSQLDVAAACLGSRFSIRCLASVASANEQQVAKDLWPVILSSSAQRSQILCRQAMQAGLLVPVEHNYLLWQLSSDGKTSSSETAARAQPPPRQAASDGSAPAVWDSKQLAGAAMVRHSSDVSLAVTFAHDKIREVSGHAHGISRAFP